MAGVKQSRMPERAKRMSRAAVSSLELAKHEIKMRRSEKPAYYAWIYWWLVPVARANGYALALHGSMSRDLDVVAIPWTDEAVSAEALINAFASYAPGWSRNEATKKPHGRLAFSILLGGGAYVDVSVVPLVVAETTEPPIMPPKVIRQQKSKVTHIGKVKPLPFPDE